MTNRIFISTLLLSAAFGLSAATVISGEGKLSFREHTPLAGDIRIDFAPCMANQLFTFSEVAIDSTVVNRTGSDNIGPFGVAGGGWSGGNHTNKDADGKEMRSARTESVQVYTDGQPIDLAQPDTIACGVLTVQVVNTLFMPADTVRFCTETMIYTVSGNSIDVQASHTFFNPQPVLVDRYYGMQSMMIGETEMLTPGGAYRSWTPIGDVDRFDHASAPDFCLFVEHSPAGYQACWMDSATGLGDRHMVDASDWVFIGNSWSKAYHKLIGSRKISAGDTTSWHGVYSWFKEPLLDGARGADGHYAFPPSIAGQPVVFYTDKTGKTILTPVNQ